MTLHYSLNEEDYLQALLFHVSHNARLVKKRKKIVTTIVIALIIVGLLSYFTKDKTMAYYFLFMAMIFFFFYPLYQRWYYKKFYRKYLIEKTSPYFNDPTEITLSNDVIEISNKIGISKLNTTELDKLWEINSYFILGYKTDDNLIIPKACLKDVALTRNRLIDLARIWNIEFTEALNWKWK